MTARTILQTILDMAEILDAEGLGRNRDKAAIRLVERGYRPRHVAAFLDLAMTASQTPKFADLPVEARATFRGLRGDVSPLA